MHIDAKGCLESAKIAISPNFNPRPVASEVNLLVIHNASLPEDVWGVDDIIALFQNNLDLAKDPSYHDLLGRQVSSHFLIARDGEIYQLVSIFDRAWHAGVSEFQGVANCNDYSVGIELNGSDHQPFTEEQYKSLAELTHAIMRCYPAITLDRIVGHSDIALPAGRKTDPGPYFDWAYYRSLLEPV